MKTILFLLMFLPVSLSAQISSADYSSPTNGVASSGGLLQSADYAASGTVIWYDCSLIGSADYSGLGIGNAEIVNANITGVEENLSAIDTPIVSPNPLTELSTLNISVMTQTTIRLTLFDVTGAEVYAETFDNKSAGKHAFSLRNFCGRTAHAGVYLLKLDVGNAVEVIKIMKL